MRDHPRLEKAIKRVLMELNNSILKRRAYNAMHKLNSSHGLDFFRVCSAALQNDLYAGIYRAFDQHKDAASFWYIQNIAGGMLLEAAKKAAVSLDELQRVSAKLKPIRDRVHFHVDRSTLEDGSKPWKDADITGNELIWLADSGHSVLREMLLNLTGEDCSVPDYQGDDIGDIMRAYKKEFPNAPLSI